MIARVLVLAALLAGLVTWERALGREQAGARRSRMQIQELVPEDTRDGMLVAAIRLRTGAGDELLYARSQGVWRCREIQGLPARRDLIERLIAEATTARGVVHSEEPRHPESYGFDSPSTLRLSLHGAQLLKQADQDLQLELDLGRSIPSGTGCYVRRPGSKAVWAIDGDLRALVDWDGGSDLPPLLDPFVVPMAWTEAADQVLRMALEHPGGTSFDLEIDFTPRQEVSQGAPEWTWRLRTGGQTLSAHPILGMAYAIFLQRLPWEGLLDPAQSRDAVLKQAVARVTLVPRLGEPVALTLGEPLADGKVPVVNEASGHVFLISAEVAALITPELAWLTDPNSGNVWDAYLH